MVLIALAIVGPRYGFHRDELYFIAAGRRLAWGYVDQPFLTPLIARAMDSLPGTISPGVLRIPAALSASAVVVLAGTLTRIFGGTRSAVIAGSAMVALGGFFLGVGHLLSTTTFDVLLWVAIVVVVAHLIAGGSPRWWLLVGVLVGVGMLNKYTIMFLVVALLIGLLLTPQRSVLAGSMPWIGAGIAVVVALPNLIWQMANGWPQLEMARALAGRSEGIAEYILLQIAILSVFLVVPATAGFVWLVRDPVGRRWRLFAFAFALVLFGVMATGGKGYYVAALYVPLLAGGAVWLSNRSVGARTAVYSLVGIGGVVGFLIALPLVPPASVNPFNEINGELGETYAWDQFVDQVEAVYLGLPESDRTDAAVMTANYGQAGAIEVLSMILPQPVSGHNNYWLWGPPADTTSLVIVIGELGEPFVGSCTSLVRTARVTNAAGVENDELGTPISVCRSPKFPLSAIWDELRHYE